MSINHDHSDKELKKQADQEKSATEEKKSQTGPVAGGADNTRGENTSGSKVANSDQANLSTTTRGADSTDKEFRNDQPDASTLKKHKSNEDLANE
ncbi:hypothetical protein MKJ04_04940 [Pontibacter sp. E15-1]|uniref:hypothetical protein n=1 Tax=Pontibacter sp. E15-1 TaxID=2919918 RepID=UPI001F4F99F2|nr:hypothetical protein [Pontibacter sp. E15-1]MCJ8164178.1 hypothetical protein [Pontibacter sp. E15-1]